MAKNKTHTIEELQVFLENSRKELRKIELDMARRYSGLTFSEIRDLDTKAAAVASEIKRILGKINALQKRLADK